ncbi:hypothetical protein [Niastella sp. OAS944]|uniref:hypothetical protein n=1 Tax=Niastella sp. OAS944 TaxID=2664089 RepID=UPI0034864138|nr:hypothetical protein [Chitinophagaceae bacterium OAS944]
MTALQRKDLFLLAFLYLVVLLIFYPLFYTEYVYTDEAVQLWNYRPDSGFIMFAIQGRWITELLIGKSFKAANSIHDITNIRIFALAMWILCVPVWYVIIKRITANGAGYGYLPFFTCLYLVTSLQFSITVQWASCIELPIANTAGLVSGAILYRAIMDKERWLAVPFLAALGATLAAMISLSSYQSGFGCFLIPFLFHYVSAHTTGKDVVFIKGLAFYFLMYAVYFVVFKIYLTINHIPGDARTGVSLNPIKIIWFLWQPLKRAFWFNLVINNDNILGLVMYFVLLAGWVALAFIRFGKMNRMLAVKYVAAASLVYLVAYVPGLVVKENYSSNRTLLAVDMCVWLACAEMVMYIVKSVPVRRVAGFVVAAVLCIAGWYNFNKVFLQPIHEEYTSVKGYILQHYNNNITTIHFIQPTEDAFRKKYHIAFSMDEFGVPSTFFDWVPEALTKLLVYEKTGNREVANSLIVKYWENEESYKASGEQVTTNTLLVNMPELISGDSNIANH